ncbi:hypothetical protein SynA1524_00803 [Synechococcus sp. A15-24]|nr:hypothetical protein SynA1524_00803 [Synechococcus sp. A15-24]
MRGLALRLAPKIFSIEWWDCFVGRTDETINKTSISTLFPR